ncbi:hypothetical protein GTY77_18215 [Streptomyces sp. SID8380]|nr:hypothetical protein [Streptomyces sp. SID8380]
MSEQNKIDEIKEDLNPIIDEVWEKDVFDVITNQDGKIIAEVFDKDAAQLFAKSPEYITHLIQQVEFWKQAAENQRENNYELLKKIAVKDKALRTMAESPDEWYVGTTPMREFARQSLEAL